MSKHDIRSDDYEMTVESWNEEVYNHENGMLIVGSAGTGKTTELNQIIDNRFRWN